MGRITAVLWDRTRPNEGVKVSVPLCHAVTEHGQRALEPVFGIRLAQQQSANVLCLVALLLVTRESVEAAANGTLPHGHQRAKVLQQSCRAMRGYGAYAMANVCGIPAPQPAHSMTIRQLWALWVA